MTRTRRTARRLAQLDALIGLYPTSYSWGLSNVYAGDSLLVAREALVAERNALLAPR